MVARSTDFDETQALQKTNTEDTPVIPQKRKLLVVDDDPFVRSMLREILESGGYSVETASNGIVALEQYFSHPDISLIISDVNMAEMNGLEFIRELRKKNSEIPIIMLTVNTEISVALEAIKGGANDYLLKDENILETILLSVKKTLEKHDLKIQNLRLMEDLAQKNEELERSNKELIELSQTKSRFLRIAAHDLRNPLGGIIGLSEILLNETEETTEEERREYLETIHNASKEMLTLLNDLLDLSVIESGKLELQLRMESLRSLIESRIKISRVIAEQKKITIQTNLADTPDTLFDAARIAQVFDNLMSNAIKFSPEGSCIHVGLEQEDDMLTVSIKDEGPGISEEDQGKLFQEFERLKTRPTHGEKSTGLGLVIAAKMVEAHQGMIEVQSKPGLGSVFRFKLPIKK